MSKKNEAKIVDALSEKPIRFSVKAGKEKRFFELRPPCLGKLEILSKELLQLEFDDKKLQEEPVKEALRICESKPDVACRIIALAVQDTKEDLLNDEKVEKDMEFFKWNCTPSDFATIMITVITQSRFENFTNAIRALKQTCELNKQRG